MKLKILFLVLFVAGIAASIALASPSHTGTGTTATTGTTASTGTTTTTTTGKHDDDDDHHGANGKHSGNGCRSVELRGTLSAGSVTLTPTATSKRVRTLVAGTPVALAIPAGPGSIRARLCTDAAGAQTLQLAGLRVANGSHDG